MGSEYERLPMAELVHRCPRCGKQWTSHVHRRQDNRGTAERPIRCFCPQCNSYRGQWGKTMLETVK